MCNQAEQERNFSDSSCSDDDAPEEEDVQASDEQLETAAAAQAPIGSKGVVTIWILAKQNPHTLRICLFPICGKSSEDIC